MKELHLYTDGGSRGNPGPAAVGIVLKTAEGEILKEKGKSIGKATNNEAEYQALIEGLKLAQKYNPQKLICFLDSNLVVNQLNGNWKVKKAHLRKLVFKVREEMAQLLGTRVTFQHISREKNTEADELLNTALDNKKTEEEGGG
ncbi:MAG: ribonuclease HI family protein [Patescibacteria group bacterium]|nr:ribonuclease HI family protein [Patescibacteria group bacterium]